jgi:excisionase family DNA binding protein
MQEPLHAVALNTLLTASDVAGIIGCSSRSITRMVDAGLIPEPVRLGKLARWPRQQFEQWIAAGCPQSPRK